MFDILERSQKVCLTWRRICKDPMTWRAIHMEFHVHLRQQKIEGNFTSGKRNKHLHKFHNFNVHKMCHHAIDLSCGNLVDISIRNCGTDELLEHMTDSSRGIRRLSIVFSAYITMKGLSKVASKLPMLEDLAISYTPRISKSFGVLHSCEYLEVIGRSCPLLKSLKLNMHHGESRLPTSSGKKPQIETKQTLTSSAMVRSSTKRNRLNSAELPNRTRRSWSELPEELTFQVLSRLGAIDVLTSAQKVCTQWRRMCKHPMVWRTIDMANDHFFHEVHYDLDKMCRHAVDRSFGRVEDINVEYFGTDELLKYITDSSSGIKHLSLAHCPRITDKGLTEMAPKLPLLEDLVITSCKNISHEPLKVIGSSCPLLKSFKLDTWFKLPEDEVYDDTVFNIEEGEDTDVEVEANAEVNANAVAEVVMDREMDADALAIAGSMHGLHHLQLFRNELTNDGLSEILDHCPRLESLDLRYCYNLNLKGDLGIKCAKRIKRLQLPDNSTDIPEIDLLKKDTVWFTYRSADDVEGHVADVIIGKTIDFTDDYEW